MFSSSERSLREPPWFRDSSFLLFGVFVLIHFLFLTRLLIVPDLILSYPFMGGDSHDWVSTGLSHAGHDVRATSRPPLLPLLVAGLSAFSALHLLPVLVQLLVHATMLGLYRLLCLDYPRPLAWVVSAVWLLNGSWLRLSLDVMADVPAACLLAWAAIAWRRSGAERPGYVAAGLCGGLSAVTQQLALLLPAAVLPTVLWFRRRDLVSRPFLIGAALFAAPTGVWLLWMRRAMSEAGDDLGHWSTLRFHTDSVDHYFYQYVAFVGLPAAAGIVAGVVSFLRRARHEPWCGFVLALQAVICVFFVFLYDATSLRFLAYVFPLSAVLLAEGLSRLRRPAASVGVALAALLWALPFPGELADRRRMVLWPAPLTYAVAAATSKADGSRQLDPLDLAVEVRPASALLRHNVYSLAKRRRPAAFEPRALRPESFAGDLWGLYYYAAPETAGDHRAVTLELGNLLRKRVHYLPLSTLEPVRSSLGLSRLGVLDGKALYRARMAGRDAGWIVAVRAGSDADEELRAAPRGLPEAASAVALAERVAARIGRRPTAFFATSRGVAAWQAFLPLFVDTSYFFVIEPESEAGARRLLGTAGPATRVDGARLVEYELFGTKWIVAERVSGAGGNGEPGPQRRAPRISR